MRLLLDEMYAPAVAEQLRARGNDVASVHDPAYRVWEGEPDEDVWAAAIAGDRALVTENVGDFRRIEADSLASGAPPARQVRRGSQSSPRGATPGCRASRRPCRDGLSCPRHAESRFLPGG